MTYDTNDMNVSKQLGRIEEGIKNITARLNKMAETWDTRIEKRDKEKEAIETRLDALERHNAMVEGMAKPVKIVGMITVGSVIGLIAEFIARVLIR